MTRWLRYAACATPLLVGCAEQESTQRRSGSRVAQLSLRLVEQESYGDSAQEQGSVRVAYGGGVLGKVIDAVETSTGTILILDPSYKKIAVFTQDGEYERLILGGAGQGPGEFLLPMAIDVDANSRIYVYDFDLKRTTVFESNGEIATVITTPVQAKDFRVDSGNRFLFTRLPAGTHYVSVLDVPTGEVENWGSVTAADQQQEPSGSTSYLFDIDGQAAVGLGLAGQWLNFDTDRDQHRIGVAPVDSSTPGRMYDGVWLQPAQAYGYAQLSNGCIVTAYSITDFASTPPRLAPRILLDVLTRAGDLIGTLTVPVDFIITLSESERRNSFYVGVNNPYPRLVRYMVTAESDSEFDSVCARDK